MEQGAATAGRRYVQQRRRKVDAVTWCSGLLRGRCSGDAQGGCSGGAAEWMQWRRRRVDAVEAPL